MGDLGVHVLEGEEVVGHLGWTSHLAGPVEAEDQEVHHEAIVLHYERGKLKSPDNSIGVGVIHVLVVDHHVVLGSHVVGDVVVHDQPQQPVEQCQVNLLVQLLKLTFHHHITFSISCFPNILKIVDSLAPFVGQKWWRLTVTWFDPWWEQLSLVSFIPTSIKF